MNQVFSDILFACEVVEDKENDSRDKSDNDEIAVENVNMNVNRRKTKCCGLKKKKNKYL